MWLGHWLCSVCDWLGRIPTKPAVRSLPEDDQCCVQEVLQAKPGAPVLPLRAVDDQRVQQRWVCKHMISKCGSPAWPLCAVCDQSVYQSWNMSELPVSVGHPFYHCVQSRISKSSNGERMSELFFKCGSPVQRLHSPWSARSIKVRKRSYYL